ncbi:DUF4129 domain-containing protein [Pseudoxanthomonas sp. LH2527]|uniref:DUF4129 domain-containing protein n=1 Tax=Pseudoxanthomonas sp. LH2527 TaxID=2923249 RepID=UPI001F13A47F|nr:DUF4129 domain-containing protein [Pseudoxanthomonas sp. LH2527]MCH6485079.1 DUF4129 domain-containing protein [Pseudoxanthomonas sp. LH2527]
MRIEQLTVRLRARSDWEAIELGMALVRQHAGAIWRPWLWFTLPVFALLNLGAWWIDRMWVAALLMWWLKPAFDRIPLYVISRAVFGSVPGTRDTLRAQAHWGLRTLPHLLTWRRFSPVRALYMPIDLLEGVQGERLRQRRRVLGGQAYGTAILLTWICLLFQGVLMLGGIVAVVMYLPQDLLPDSVQAAFQIAAIAWPVWFELAWNALAWAAISVIEPFYVGAGFGLYLNRRTQIEAWDLEIVFRKLRARLAAAAPMVLAAVLWAGAGIAEAQERHGAPPVAPAPAETTEAEEKPTPPTLPLVFGDQRVDDRAFHKAADQAYRDPLLDRRHVQSGWERRTPEEKQRDEDAQDGDRALLAGFGTVLAFIGEWGLWLVVGVLVVMLLATVRYWWPWMRGLTRAPVAAPEAPQTEALVLPETLPDDIATAARRLWRDGRPRHALALLYRASVDSMSQRADLVLPPGATEAECLRASRRMPLAEDRQSFARIVRTWQYAAYAERLPGDDEFDALVGELQQRYGWAA